MPSTESCSRRDVLTGSASLLVAGLLAGCAGDGSDAETTTPTATDGGSPTDTIDGTADGNATETTTDTDTEADTETETATHDRALDLREANVVDVAYEDTGDGRYDVDVTLHHDDDGEDGYADWWQVETMQGSRLGRRDLAHPHSRQPFTRSATIDIPRGTTCVVVRGHDQTHGYGGRAMILNLELDATRTVDQGSEPGQFAPGDCP